ELVGGLDVRQLAGKPVLVGQKKTPGVIGTKPIHFTSDDEHSKPIPLESLRIDLGGEAVEKAKIGDRATFATSFERVSPSLRGKALDNRIGVATLIELVKNPPLNIELLAAFTVQEEVGLRGAKVASYALNPDLAIVLDCTPANDLPMWDDSENTRYNTRLGAGPAVYVADAGTVSDPRLVRYLLRTAESYGIPCQIRQPGGGGTVAGAIHRQRQGIPSVSLSVPARYTHTAVSLCRVGDWESTLKLLFAALQNINRSVLERA
ncbi:MAG: hypothetical protein U1B80_09735, partial [Anaerolineaceae bacterium]|nr:hypothetical protein [Anaerolineaceae bacterium]